MRRVQDKLATSSQLSVALLILEQHAVEVIHLCCPPRPTALGSVQLPGAAMDGLQGCRRGGRWSFRGSRGHGGGSHEPSAQPAVQDHALGRREEHGRGAQRLFAGGRCPPEGAWSDVGVVLSPKGAHCSRSVLSLSSLGLRGRTLAGRVHGSLTWWLLW